MQYTSCVQASVPLPAAVRSDIERKGSMSTPTIIRMTQPLLGTNTPWNSLRKGKYIFTLG